MTSRAGRIYFTRKRRAPGPAVERAVDRLDLEHVAAAAEPLGQQVRPVGAVADAQERAAPQRIVRSARGGPRNSCSASPRRVSLSFTECSPDGSAVTLPRKSRGARRRE